MNDIGHNLPPDMTITAGEVTMDLSGYMAENPIIETEEQAREAKVFIDRGSLCVKDLEDERTAKVRPLNEQVKQINDHYRSPRELLESMVNELRNRISAFMLQEEAARLAIAEAARRAAEDAERVAREAEARERGAYEEASAGTLGVDLGSVTAEADTKFKEFERAAHKAALAEREAKVRIGGGFSRALGLKNKEELVIVDADAAFKAIGMNDYIEEALLKSARAYRKLHNKLPAGIELIVERKA